MNRENNSFLLVSYFFPPVGGAGSDRITKICKFVPRYGWTPHILTVKNPYYSIASNIQDSNVISEIPVYRTGAFLPKRFALRMKNLLIKSKTKSSDAEIVQANPSINRNMFLRKFIYPWLFFPDEYAGWIPYAVSAGCSIVRKNNLKFIYTSSPPNSAHCIGYLIKKRCNVPWIAEFRDAWNVWDEWYNASQWCFRNRLEKRLEKLVIQNADRVVAATDGIKEDILERISGIAREKCAVIPNGWDPDDVKNITPYDYGGRFTLIHAGSFYWWRKPDNFLKGVRKWLDSGKAEMRKKCAVEFLGRIEGENKIKIQESGLEQIVSCPGMLSYKDTLGRLAGADVLILIIGDLLKPELMRTRKLYDYMITGKPILVLGAGSEAELLLKEIGARFKVVDPGKPEEIAAALDEFALNHSAPGKTCDKETDPPWQYAWNSIANQFNVLFHELCGQKQ